MSETTATPSAATEPSAATPAAPATSETAALMEKTELSIRSLLEAGAHFGHLTRRWNPLMRPYIFGARNGTHILDLDQTYALFSAGLDFLRNTTAAGGNVLFVGTKRQASAIVKEEAERAGQFYVNNRWLGGMLTNWKTVKKSIDTYKSLLEILGDEEKKAAHSKKELARMSRLADKYTKSLEGMKDMPRVPDAMFVIDVSKEDIAISEGRRLGIPIIAVVDSNCSPRGIDFVVPGNDDATRAIQLYCRCVADACIEGKAVHQEQLVAQRGSEPAGGEKAKPSGGRRVVEIKQVPRRGRTTGSGRTHSSGGWADKREGGSAESGPTVVVKPASAAPAPAAAPSEPPAADAGSGAGEAEQG